MMCFSEIAIGINHFFSPGNPGSATIPDVVGTMGYLAYELGHTSKATPSNDVFTLGEFLPEITCGRMLIDQHERNNVILVNWMILQWRKA
jgi:hypothetical protein